MTAHEDPAPRRVRTRRGTLNPEMIVAAAIGIISSEGLDRLTMARLAEELGVRGMAVYNHFRDKEAILQAVATELYGRFEKPELGDDPVESLGLIARAFFKLLSEHPAVLRIEPMSIDNAAEAHVSEAMYECLLPLELSAGDVVVLVSMLTRYVIGSAYLYPDRHTWDDDPHHWEGVRQRWGSLSPETFPAMRTISRDFPSMTQQEVFESGLDALLRGIRATTRLADGDAQPA